jgi:hypothetical protein
MMLLLLLMHPIMIDDKNNNNGCGRDIMFMLFETTILFRTKLELSEIVMFHKLVMVLLLLPTTTNLV